MTRVQIWLPQTRETELKIMQSWITFFETENLPSPQAIFWEVMKIQKIPGQIWTCFQFSKEWSPKKKVELQSTKLYTHNKENIFTVKEKYLQITKFKGGLKPKQI